MSRCSTFDWPLFLLATSCDGKLCLTSKEAAQQQPVHHFGMCAGLL